MLVLFVMSCEKDNSIADTEIVLDNTERQILPDSQIGDRGSNKVDVCHNGHINNVSINAVPAHQGHGDAVDMDGDGYFDMANDCTSGVDCDDTDAAVNPGATEICNNGIDDDCNPNTPDICCDMSNVPSIEVNGTTLYVHPTDNGKAWWGGYGIWTFANDRADGAKNTEEIVDYLTGNLGYSNYAAKKCYDLVAFGCDDWYLPSKQELDAMYNNRNILGPFSGRYWSSTEHNFVSVKSRNLITGNQFNRNKADRGMHCRCVRKD